MTWLKKLWRMLAGTWSKLEVGEPKSVFPIPTTYPVANWIGVTKNYIYATASNMGHGSKRTGMYRSRNGTTWEAVYHGKEETITCPVRYKDSIYWTAEHADHLRICADSVYQGHVPPGAWGCGTMLYKGQPIGAFNAKYSGGTMHDKPTFLNLSSGSPAGISLDKTCFPFSLLADINGKDLYALCACGWNGLWSSKGWEINANLNTVGQLDTGELYAGEGKTSAGARVWAIKDGKLSKELGNTGAGTTSIMFPHKGRLFVTTICPNQLFVIEGGKLKKLQTIAQTAGSKLDFGSGLSVFNGDLYWIVNGGVYQCELK